MTSSNTVLKHTPFYDYHVKHEGRMVDFAGWEMPLLYKKTGIIAEHEHTRNEASIFDVSHMGRVKFTGSDATKFLQKMLTRNIEKSDVGQSMYSLVCNNKGGILDDVIVSRFDNHWLMVCNASNREKLLGWFAQEQDGYNVKIEDETFSTAMVAIQGPKVIKMLDDLLPSPASDLKRYHFEVQRYMMIISFTVFRSGYTGEDGVEIILPNAIAGMGVKLLGGDGDTSIIKPAGLGARDTLRMEAGMPLYGHELNEEIDPISAGLGWAVDLSKDFIGVEALRDIQQNGPKRKLVGLFIEGPRAARQHMTLHHDGKVIGEVTSGAMSPTLKRCIAMAYVDAQYATPGTALSLDLRGSQTPVTVTTLPFYKRKK